METPANQLASSPAAGGEGSDVMPASAPNAYVGPQPFPPDRQLYGRDRELLALTNRLLSERLVLLYSPSGAGKTSLIRAKGGLGERMAGEGCRPLPVIRVSHAADVAVQARVNRYWLSALISLELERPGRQRRTAAELAQLLRPADGDLPEPSLDAYLAALTPPDEKGNIPQTFLVFDQFEELLTLDPTDDDQKREFLRQVGSALRVGHRWALFAMREDHVGALDPYLPLLPTRLSVTFRLDLLRREAAEEAICRPATEFGATFEQDAVGKLLSELDLIQVQNVLTGKPEPRHGQYVEPLHLQLVCQRLWNKKESPDRIALQDLNRLTHEAAGDMRGVAAALAHYYDDSVRSIAGQLVGQGVSERAIRNWFSGALISPNGLRLPVLLGNEAAYGLSGPVLRALANCYLIRSEQRHGGIYYELAHDRLVEPIQKSNAAWRKRLTAFQQQAELWKEKEKKNDLLVFGEVLAEGERLEGLGELSNTDREFLAACREARAARQAQEERKQAQRRKRAYLVGAVLVACVCLGVALYIYESWLHDRQIQQKEKDAAELKATEMRKLKDAYEDYLAAWPLLTDKPGKSLEIAKRSLKLFRECSSESPPQGLISRLLPEVIANRTMRTFGAERKHVSECVYPYSMNRHRTAVKEIVFAGSRRQRLLTRDSDGNVLGWDDWRGELPSHPCRRISGVSQMMATPEGQYLVVGHSSGQVCRWKMEDWEKSPPYDSPNTISDSSIVSLSVSHREDRPYVVVGHADGGLQLFDWRTRDRLESLSEVRMLPTGPFSFAILTPDSSHILTGNSGEEFRFWNVPDFQRKKDAATHRRGPKPQEIIRVALADNGRLIATATEEGRVFVYRVGKDLEKIGDFLLPKAEINEPNSGSRPRLRVPVLALASGQGVKRNTVFVVAASDIGVPGLWRLDLADNEAGEKVELVPKEWGKGDVAAIAFSSDGKRLAAGMWDGSARVWQLDNHSEQPFRILKTWFPDPLDEKSPTVTRSSPVTALLFGGDQEEWLFTGHGNGDVHRWNLEKQENIETVWEQIQQVLKDPKSVTVEDLPALDIRVDELTK